MFCATQETITNSFYVVLGRDKKGIAFVLLFPGRSISEAMVLKKNRLHFFSKVKLIKGDTEDFNVIKVLEFNKMRTYFDVLEKIFIDRIMRNPVEF